jgi:hypothetical protein
MLAVDGPGYGKSAIKFCLYRSLWGALAACLRSAATYQ